MSLHSDYNELSQTFYKVSGFAKAIMAISFFFSFSSIASLADVVFHWKGFIHDGIEFYRSYIVEPVIHLASLFNLSYSTDEIHAAVVSSVSIGIGMRLAIAGQRVAFNNFNAMYGSDMKPNLRFFWIIAIALPPATSLWYGFSDQDPNMWRIFGVALVYPLFLVLPKEVMSRFGSKGGYAEKGDFSYFKGYYGYIVLIALGVGILGAINTGISKVA